MPSVSKHASVKEIRRAFRRVALCCKASGNASRYEQVNTTSNPSTSVPDALRGASTTHVVDLSLADICAQTDQTMSFSRWVIVCRAKQRVVHPRDLLHRVVQPCDCNGGSCVRCDGKGIVLRKDTFMRRQHNVTHILPVDAHTSNGTRWVLKHEGDMRIGQVPGDIVCIARVNDPHFTCKGSHLIERLPRIVSFAEAVAGKSSLVYHPDGCARVYRIPPGDVLRCGGANHCVHAVAKGQGLIANKSDLYVRFIVRTIPGSDEDIAAFIATLRTCLTNRDASLGTRPNWTFVPHSHGMEYVHGQGTRQ